MAEGLADDARGAAAVRVVLNDQDTTFTHWQLLRGARHAWSGAIGVPTPTAPPPSPPRHLRGRVILPKGLERTGVAESPPYRIQYTRFPTLPQLLRGYELLRAEFLSGRV